MGGVFGLGILGVVDQQIGVGGVFEQNFVESGMAVLQVGGDDHTGAGAFDR